eukprot:6458964-Amphidinium_carterae.1
MVIPDLMATRMLSVNLLLVLEVHNTGKINMFKAMLCGRGSAASQLNVHKKLTLRRAYPAPACKTSMSEMFRPQDILVWPFCEELLLDVLNKTIRSTCWTFKTLVTRIRQGHPA